MKDLMQPPATPDPRQLQLASAVVHQLDGLFLTSAGSIDLLAMSNKVSPEIFRHYIESVRYLRELKRN